VLSHHYPDVPNLGDMTKITKERMNELGPVNVFLGGTPCQSFSVAGLRKGLADPRGNLALEYLRIADALQPDFLVWENVPGVLSSNGGRDFGAFLGGLAELGYGWAYRVLDAQYFGVAQRRRRVFVVGCAGGDWQRAAEILFEPESLRGDSPPSREAGKDAAACLTRGVGQRYDPETETLPVVGPIPEYYTHDYSGDRIYSTASAAPNQSACGGAGCRNIRDDEIVRRLTPRECERLQGFPDNYTLIHGAADAPRYKALGNSMAVPVMRWIFKRIEQHK
jgi:DNA (cytosine-5)-methyltransferase 1